MQRRVAGTRRGSGAVTIFGRRGAPLLLHRDSADSAGEAAQSAGGDIDALQAFAVGVGWCAGTYFVWKFMGFDAVVAAHGLSAVLWALIRASRSRRKS